MTTKLFIIAAMLFLSCNQPEQKNINPTLSIVNSKVEAYIKAQTNNPELYKSLKTSIPEVVSNNLLITECYGSKYAPKEIDFNKKNTFKAPEASTIKEKFYSVVHEFNALNKFGAIEKHTAVVYLDSTNNILFSNIVL